MLQLDKNHLTVLNDYILYNAGIKLTSSSKLLFYFKIIKKFDLILQKHVWHMSGYVNVGDVWDTLTRRLSSVYMFHNISRISKNILQKVLLKDKYPSIKIYLSPIKSNILAGSK